MVIIVKGHFTTTSRRVALCGGSVSTRLGAEVFPELEREVFKKLLGVVRSSSRHLLTFNYQQGSRL